MYIDKTLKEYFDDLAAKKAAPGGGSASAAVAATGTSLMSMVANFTI
ncbi:MAG: cyclodeaminase/cyclohydrolase family protein, partial [Candidatus Omnitrophica bacterium]|nr:cyclodeaminase/cyclohydrolase family protein [Candidatus Omnitrophota bacterium]